MATSDRNNKRRAGNEEARPRNVMRVELTTEDRGRRLKDYLKNRLHLSGRNIKRLAMDRQIYVDRRRVHLDYKIRGGERLVLNLDREEDQDMARVAMDLTIVYEDSSLVVVNKPPFLVVHPTRNHQDDTLTNGLLWHFQETNDPAIVRLVSRLDMNTSGLVLVAKNQFTHSAFARAKAGEKPLKTYLAITAGHWAEPAGLIDAPIHWPDKQDYRRMVDEAGQPSRTRYKVLEEFSDFSLVEFILETGRTHQIRVHASHLGHPLVGDELYGGPLLEEKPRQFLHAWKLQFRHPMTGQELSLKALLPQDMADFIKTRGGSWQDL